MPAALVNSTFDTLNECGRGRSECVVFWTGPIGGELVDQVAHPRHRRSSTHYTVDNEWLNHFWFRLAAQRRRIQAQLHTHPGTAFHSATDDVGAVGAHEGFVSIVIPSFAMRRSLVGSRAYVITRTGWQLAKELDHVLKVTS